jgi:hypothetical protein
MNVQRHLKEHIMKIAGLTSLLGVVAFVGLAPAQEKTKPPSPNDLIEGRVPTPPAVGTRKLDVGFEMAAPMNYPSIVTAKDGRLMMIGAGSVRYSDDKGKTWSKPEKLSAPIRYARRLNSGKLGGPATGLYYFGAPVTKLDNPANGLFYTSDDDGKSWQAGGTIQVGGVPAKPYEGVTLMQTKSGRLILPVRFTAGAGHMGFYDQSGSFGTFKGKLVKVEGHGFFAEPDTAFAFYSDDEGKTWQRSEGGIMIWHKEGYGGMWPCDEPSVVEAQNGDILMFCRTNLGRLYIARSGPVDYVAPSGQRVQRTPGQRFDNPQPTVLANSHSPCAIRRIPKTGDLLLVWNQVSGDEIRAGYRRGRLSSAISKDDGKTWQHYRTIDAVVLPPAGRVEPDAEPQMVRGLDYVGVVPEDMGAVHYPDLEIIDDTVFLSFNRVLRNPRPGDVIGRRLRVLPLSWFYQDEPASPPAPKLFIKVPVASGAEWNTYEVPARFHEGRFYCNSTALAVPLMNAAGRLGRDIDGPLHQVVTCLGWDPAYDRSHLKDVSNPRMIVTLTHSQTQVPAKQEAKVGARAPTTRDNQ